MMSVSPDFTVDSFHRLLEGNDMARELYEYCSESVNVHSKLKNYFDLVILLRASFEAGPSIIESILSGIPETVAGPDRISSGEMRKYVMWLSLEADRYIMRQRSLLPNDLRMIRMGSTKSGAEPLILQIDARPCLDDIESELVRRFGPAIHLARSGLYLIRLERGAPLELRINDRNTNHIHEVVAFPCTFLIRPDSRVREKGAILLFEQIADRFNNDAGRCRQRNPLMIYFWFHGRNFILTQAPPESASNMSTAEHCVDWLCQNRKDIHRMWKKHHMDRDRKTKSGRMKERMPSHSDPLMQE